jgi:hypothetical protein
MDSPTADIRAGSGLAIALVGAGITARAVILKEAGGTAMQIVQIAVRPISLAFAQKDLGALL